MIIDFHMHIFPDAIAKRSLDKLSAIADIIPYSDGTAAGTIQKLDDCGIDMGVSLNIATSPTQQTTINNHVKMLNDTISDRVISFGSVHYLSPHATSELERIHQMGIKGIKMHPDYQDFMVDDKRVFPIYEECQKLGLIVVLHSGWDCFSPDLVHSPALGCSLVAKTFPKLKLVLAHMGGLCRWDEVETHLVGLENVYMDTAMCATYQDSMQGKRIIENHHPDNILLGSDCPWEDPAASVRYVRTLDISDNMKEKILSKNAMKILGISPK